MVIFAAMFALGLLLGFVGVGGAGIVIAILTVFFRIPIHTALGTSLGAMGFTTIAGVLSHFRENNVAVRCGLAVGIFGALGAFLGVKIATLLPSSALTRLTGCMMFFSAVLLCIRMFFYRQGDSSRAAEHHRVGKGWKFWLAASGVGFGAGVLSGAFGIGAAPFIQLGLLIFFGLSLPEVAGTTMLVTLPIAVTGGFGYLTAGYLDMKLFIIVILGLMSGTYIGAKFTRRLHPSFLKIAMIITPIVGGSLLIFCS
jgi:uncharacterized membrane protein YfcA